METIKKTKNYVFQLCFIVPETESKEFENLNRGSNMAGSG